MAFDMYNSSSTTGSASNSVYSNGDVDTVRQPRSYQLPDHRSTAAFEMYGPGAELSNQATSDNAIEVLIEEDGMKSQSPYQPKTKQRVDSIDPPGQKLLAPTRSDPLVGTPIASTVLATDPEAKCPDMKEIQYPDRYRLCQELVSQTFDAIATRFRLEEPQRAAPDPATLDTPADPLKRSRQLASECCFACVAKLRAAELGTHYAGECVRRRASSPKRRPAINSNKSQILMSSRYVATLHRLSEDGSVGPTDILRSPFQVPAEDREVKACVHDFAVDSLPQRPFEDEDGDCYYVDDSNNVQQFFFHILTYCKWKSWLGSTLATTHPYDVSQFCRSFQVVNSSTVEPRESRPLRAHELKRVRTKGGLRRCSILPTMIPIQKLMLEIIWLVICELRDNSIGIEQAHADIKAIYQKYGQDAANRAVAERGQAREEAKREERKQRHSFSWNRETLKSWKKRAQASASNLIEISRNGTKLSMRRSHKSVSQSCERAGESSEVESRRTSTSRKSSRWSFGILR